MSRIPVLGYLFGSTEDKIEKTELLLLITPRVIGTAADGARITDQMRKATPELEQSLKMGPPPPPKTPPIPPPHVPPPPQPPRYRTVSGLACGNRGMRQRAPRRESATPHPLA